MDPQQNISIYYAVDTNREALGLQFAPKAAANLPAGGPRVYNPWTIHMQGKGKDPKGHFLPSLWQQTGGYKGTPGHHGGPTQDKPTPHDSSYADLGESNQPRLDPENL